MARGKVTKPVYPIMPPTYDQSTMQQLTELLRLRDQSMPNSPISDSWTVTASQSSYTLTASTATTLEVATTLTTLISDLRNAGYLGGSTNL